MDAERQQVENCLHRLATNDDHLSGTDALLVTNLAEQPSLSTAQVVFGARLHTGIACHRRDALPKPRGQR